MSYLALKTDVPSALWLNLKFEQKKMKKIEKIRKNPKKSKKSKKSKKKIVFFKLQIEPQGARDVHFKR